MVNPAVENCSSVSTVESMRGLFSSKMKHAAVARMMLDTSFVVLGVNTLKDLK